MTNLDFNKLQKALKTHSDHPYNRLDELRVFKYRIFDEETNELLKPSDQYTIRHKKNSPSNCFIQAKAFVSSDYKKINYGTINIHSFRFDQPYVTNRHYDYEYPSGTFYKGKTSEVVQCSVTYHFIIYDDAIKEIKIDDIKNQVKIFSHDFSKLYANGIWFQLIEGDFHMEFDKTRRLKDSPNTTNVGYVTEKTKSIKIKRPLVGYFDFMVFTKKASIDDIKCKELCKYIPEGYSMQFEHRKFSSILLVPKSSMQ